MKLTILTVDFCPFGRVIVWGPIAWQHSWQIVWVKKELKSTNSRCFFEIHTSDIGWRTSLNLVTERKLNVYKIYIAPNIFKSEQGTSMQPQTSNQLIRRPWNVPFSRKNHTLPQRRSWAWPWMFLDLLQCVHHLED